MAAGDRVLDTCDDNAAPLAFSCRTANCGVCRVRVVLGAELLSPAGSEERELLSGWNAASDERLACQLVVTGEGTIELHAIQPKPVS